jgi:hypothetical protein
MSLAVAAIVAAAATIGCGGDAQKAAQKETSHIRLLTNLYAASERDLGRSPANEQEFKTAIGKMDVSLEAMKLGSIDEVFVSERDGQPLVIVYGPSPNGVVAYEQTGVDGKRQVGFKLGNVEEADETRFKELVPTPAK